MPILAPHSSDAAMAAMKDTPVIRLTLDASLQKTLEALARDRAIAQGPNISVAMIAVDNESGDVLARVGSSDYFDERRAGQVDMTRAVRSPGSTLKPFIYGLAFEDGFVHPESLIDDRPIRFGSYAPENFDMTFQGTVPVRKALQLSLNVPAIALLDRVGASRLSISPTEIPLISMVSGNTPPATFTGIAENCPLLERSTSIREPLSGNWMCGAWSPPVRTSSPTGRKRRSGNGNLALLASSAPLGGLGSAAGIFPVRAKASNRIGAAAARPTRPATGAPSGRPTQTPMVMRPSKPTDQASR